MNESDEDDERSYVMVSGGGQDVSGDEDDLEKGGSLHQKLKKRASSGSSAKNDLGLLHPQALLFCSLWYVFSGLTLYLNKYIVALGVMNEPVLAATQMWCTLLGGWFQMRHDLGPFKARSSTSAKSAVATRPMAIVGGLRFSTVILGMFALDYLPVSFTETVKSTAPAFTVVLSRLILREHTGTYVKISLIPVMGGLALCSANELNFNLIGFLAALGTNLSECLQNVFAKKLMSNQHSQKYSPAEVQFYTSKYSLFVQVPVLLLMINWFDLIEVLTTPTEENLTRAGKMWVLYLSNGVFFHFQTISAWALIDYISPVTHSVANTGKRALLIWLSVILFGNPVTFLSGLGTLVVILGVLIYNKAREVDAQRLTKHPKSTDM